MGPNTVPYSRELEAQWGNEVKFTDLREQDCCETSTFQGKRPGFLRLLGKKRAESEILPNSASGCQSSIWGSDC